MLSGMLQIEYDRETDGRWIADVPGLPGCLAYGATQREARIAVIRLALAILADGLDAGEPLPEPVRHLFALDAA